MFKWYKRFGYIIYKQPKSAHTEKFNLFPEFLSNKSTHIRILKIGILKIYLPTQTNTSNNTL